MNSTQHFSLIGWSIVAVLLNGLSFEISNASSVICEVVPAQGFEIPYSNDEAYYTTTSSALWSQEMAGADLAYDFMKRAKEVDQEAWQPANVGIIDELGPIEKSMVVDSHAFKLGLGSFSELEHGNKVMRLVAAPLVGASPAVRWQALVSTTFSEEILPGFAELKKSRAKIINASIIFSSDKTLATADEIIRSGRILVQASGNSFPEKNSSRNIANLIAVGALGPNGLPAPSSQENVVILAPSDHTQLVGHKEALGGTSGAAPLVTGALANVLAYFPDTKPHEAKWLLEITSIKTLIQYMSTNNGAGLLNAYKMARVASCLKERNANSIVDFKLNKKCLNFEDEARNRFAAGLKKFTSTECRIKRDGLKLLRQGFFLEPTPLRAKIIGEAYESLGYRTNKDFFATFATDQIEQLNFFISRLTEPSQQFTNYFGSYSHLEIPGVYALSAAVRAPASHPFAIEALRYVSEQANSPDPEFRAMAAIQAAALGHRGRQLLERLLDDPEPYVSIHAQRAQQLLESVKVWPDDEDSPLLPIRLNELP